MTFTPETAAFLERLTSIGWIYGFAAESGWTVSRIAYHFGPLKYGQTIVSGGGASPEAALAEAESRLTADDRDQAGNEITRMSKPPAPVVIAAHFTGPGVTVNWTDTPRTIQRCAICGIKILDSEEVTLAEKTQESGEVLRVTYPPMAWVGETASGFVPIPAPQVSSGLICVELVEVDRTKLKR